MQNIRNWFVQNQSAGLKRNPSGSPYARNTKFTVPSKETESVSHYTSVDCLQFSPNCIPSISFVNCPFKKSGANVIDSLFIRPLQIGPLVTRHNLVLAPLAGISDYPFRQLCREYGADLTFTEMVSIDGLLYQNQATYRLLNIRSHEHPIGFQFFGSEPEYFRKVIPQVERFRPDLIDLNFGCPVRKVVGKGAGAALLRNLKQLYRIVEATVRATALPVTAKIRIGWDAENMVAVEAAQAVEAAGAVAITVHGRTRAQGYSGRADWEAIAAVKQAVHIPVIGNGDVLDVDSARAMFRTTGVDGIMLARGALGRPWIFRQILHALQNGEVLPEPDFEQRMEVLEHHYRLMLEEYDEFVALSRMKKHFVWYTHGLPYTARLRDRIFRAQSFSEVQEIFARYRQTIRQHNRPSTRLKQSAEV